MGGEDQIDPRLQKDQYREAKILNPGIRTYIGISKIHSLVYSCNVGSA